MINIQVCGVLWFVATIYFVYLMLKLNSIEKALKEKDMNITIITRKGETDA